MGELAVIEAGPQVSVQDSGRFGQARFGVPASGPMDRSAHRIANLALGNPADAPGIEVSRGGLVLECRCGPVHLAVAGGGFAVWRDDQALPGWGRMTLHPGQRLTLRQGHWGSWTYLALPGLQTALWLGSAATHLISGLGGGVLRAGQVLHTRDMPGPWPEGPIPRPATARPRLTLRVVMGPQERFFAPRAIERFLSQPFTLTDAGDRMGVRLSGPDLPLGAPLDIASEPILRGSVQVAGDGVATVLMADHQTTGGYPKIATLLAQDIDSFAQMRPRDAVRFVAVTPDAAIASARTRAAAHDRYLLRIRQTAAAGPV